MGRTDDPCDPRALPLPECGSSAVEFRRLMHLSIVYAAYTEASRVSHSCDEPQAQPIEPVRPSQPTGQPSASPARAWRNPRRGKLRGHRVARAADRRRHSRAGGSAPVGDDRTHTRRGRRIPAGPRPRLVPRARGTGRHGRHRGRRRATAVHAGLASLRRRDRDRHPAGRRRGPARAPVRPRQAEAARESRHRRAALREPLRRPGAGLLLRRPRRGDARPTRPCAGAQGHCPRLIVRFQGPERRREDHRRETRRDHAARRQRAS